MGLIEAILEQVSLKAVFAILIAAYSVWHIICRIDEHRRIRRLGNYGPHLTTYFPLGESSLTSFVLSLKDSLSSARS